MCNFLFIEDNEFDQTFYRHFAQESKRVKNYKLASSVKEALKYLKKNKFDIVVTDYDLEDGTAFDIIEHIDNIPIIMITGKGNEEIAASAYKHGVYDYLIKDRAHNYIKKLHLTVDNALELQRVKTQLHDKENKYRLLVEYANEVIYLTNGRGNITFINEQGCSILGYSSDEIVGKHYTRFIHEEYVTTAHEFYKDRFLNHVENTYLELPFVTKDGTIMWIGLIVRDLYKNGSRASNDLTGYMAFGRDITAKIEAGKQIKYQNLELERKNKEINDTLNQLVKAKASKAATAIILIIALILFVFSEGLLEPLVEELTENQYAGFMIKGLIALSLKPLDIGVERIIMKINLEKLNKAENSSDIFSKRRSWVLRFMNLD